MGFFSIAEKQHGTGSGRERWITDFYKTLLFFRYVGGVWEICVELLIGHLEVKACA